MGGDGFSSAMTRAQVKPTFRRELRKISLSGCGAARWQSLEVILKVVSRHWIATAREHEAELLNQRLRLAGLVTAAALTHLPDSPARRNSERRSGFDLVGTARRRTPGASPLPWLLGNCTHTRFNCPLLSIHSSFSGPQMTSLVTQQHGVSVYLFILQIQSNMPFRLRS